MQINKRADSFTPYSEFKGQCVVVVGLEREARHIKLAQLYPYPVTPKYNPAGHKLTKERIAIVDKAISDIMSKT